MKSTPETDALSNQERIIRAMNIRSDRIVATALRKDPEAWDRAKKNSKASSDANAARTQALLDSMKSSYER